MKTPTHFILVLTLFFFVIIPFAGRTQNDTINLGEDALDHYQYDDSFRGKARIRVAFWNVENLFDTSNDTLTKDDEFTPGGDKHWTSYRYHEKLDNLSKVITALGGWEPVEIIGLAEVEHKWVLQDLISETTLSENGYEIIHRESSDSRGIDVAMLYRPDKFTVDSVAMITVDLGKDNRPTRDILHVTGRTLNGATLHVFINHWPSRWGGQMKTEPFRKAAARTLRHQVDSILAADYWANIIILGDFNDEPFNESIKHELRATTDSTFADSTALYNLMTHATGNTGTVKYQGSWNILDQIIVDRSTWQGHSGLKVVEGPYIFSPSFILTEDERNLGVKPNRTYVGPKYTGGYSDHLPVFVDLRLLKN